MAEDEDVDILSRLPKKIWSYWHDPQLPDLLSVCVSSWKYHLPTYEINVLNVDTLPEYIPLTDVQRQILSKLAPAKQADYFRVHLLLHHGGIWMDVSTFVNGSLDFIHRVFDTEPTREVLYFVKKRSFGKSFFSWENFFLAAAPGSYFMRKFVEKMEAVFFHGEPYQHFTKQEGWTLSLDNNYHMAYAVHNELASNDDLFRSQCEIQQWDSNSIFILTDHDRAVRLMQRYYRMYKTGNYSPAECSDFPNLFKFWHDQRHRWKAPQDITTAMP